MLLFSVPILFPLDEENKVTPKGNYLKKSFLSDSTFLFEWGNKYFQRTLNDTFNISVREPYYEWENEYAIGIKRSCGSPCWYEFILPLNSEDSVQVVYYPLEHNLEKKLVACIEDDNSVTIKNFRNQKSLIIVLEPPCNSAFPGYCIESVKFLEEEVEVKWYSDANFENKENEKVERMNISSLLK